jgi:hypothetical protein
MDREELSVLRACASLGLGQIYPSERVNIPSAEYPF